MCRCMDNTCPHTSWYECVTYLRSYLTSAESRVAELEAENARLEGVFAGLKAKVGAISWLRDRAESRVAELEEKLESVMKEIDEALSHAHWCDSTNNHGRDSVVELVDYLMHLHKVLLDDCASQDAEVISLRAAAAANSAEHSALTTNGDEE